MVLSANSTRSELDVLLLQLSTQSEIYMVFSGAVVFFAVADFFTGATEVVSSLNRSGNLSSVGTSSQKTNNENMIAAMAIARVGLDPEIKVEEGTVMTEVERSDSDSDSEHDLDSSSKRSKSDKVAQIDRTLEILYLITKEVEKERRQLRSVTLSPSPRLRRDPSHLNAEDDVESSEESSMDGNGQTSVGTNIGPLNQAGEDGRSHSSSPPIRGRYADRSPGGRTSRLGRRSFCGSDLAGWSRTWASARL
ncbi:hypothetical protein QBC39DRAFT_409004 [Podospora conica]|nr:hypothetical protein QBC39DRAFT_409004 [Schizothecium conicum]